MKRIFVVTFLIISHFTHSQPPVSDPLFPNSIVATDIDFIRSNDPDAFSSIRFIGREDKEMPDSRNDNLFDSNTFVFEATFSNTKKVGIWCHSSFGTIDAAQEYANKVAPRLGKLPEFMREIISHVVIHKGDAGAFAESNSHFFVLYSDNIDTRISNNDLEETVFHESVHASLDAAHINTNAWKQAQTDDGNFITEYAKSRSNKEDLAETTLFAYTMVKYPGRLSASIEKWVNTHIPHRLAYINESIFPESLLGINDFFFNQPSSTLKTYPNPTNNNITIVVKKVDQKNGLLTIYDITGRLINSVRAKNGMNTIDVKELAKGTYFITQGNRQNATIMKQ